MSSTGSQTHKLKIYGITSLRSDIILLSDTRWVSNQGVSGLSILSTSLLVNPYGAYIPYFNSTRNKRGVGILLGKSCDFSVEKEERDGAENILLLRLKKKGSNFQFIVGAIYGPNGYEPRFFEDIRRLLATMGDFPVILAGLWNCSHSCANRDANIDILNMTNPPNLRHSKLLKSLCDDLLLADLYRCKYPNRLEYTYIPSAVNKKNRSRLDFFIVSQSILEEIKHCSIKPTTQNKLFDHKAVSIDMRRKEKIISVPAVARFILKDPKHDILISLTVIEYYVIHTLQMTAHEKDPVLGIIGTAKSDFRKIGPATVHINAGSRSEQEDLEREGILGGIRAFLDDFSLQDLQAGALWEDVSEDYFLEGLINNIRNETISHQLFISKYF
jgi:exonuclease III